MPNFRRLWLPGHTWFFTLVTHRRQPLLVHPEVRAALRESIAEVRARLPFEVMAWVLLPEHLHALWRLPEGDSAYAARWAQIKRGVGKRCAHLVDSSLLTPGMRRRHESGFWQPRYWEHGIRDDADLERHLDYIHYNPVKHGHVSRAADWPYSTFHRYVKEGVCAADWGEGATITEGDYGE